MTKTNELEEMKNLRAEFEKLLFEITKDYEYGLTTQDEDKLWYWFESHYTKGQQSLKVNHPIG